MHSDAEAKKKWCPMVRHSTTDTKGLGVPAYNRYGISAKAISNPEISRCIASECMMWREVSVGDYKGKGYCGLAGKPS